MGKGRPRQYVIATLGRLDRLIASGQVDAIIRSLAKFSEKVKVIEDYKSNRLNVFSVKKIGPFFDFINILPAMIYKIVLKISVNFSHFFLCYAKPAHQLKYTGLKKDEGRDFKK